MAVDIDSLQIEIEATSSDAVRHIEKLYASLKKLNSVLKDTTGANKYTKTLNELRTTVRRTQSPIQRLASQVKSTGNSFGGMEKSILSAVSKLTLFGFTVNQIGRFLKSSINSASDYVETVNLFQVSMGRFYDEAFDYANLVNEKLGIDPTQWMKAQGVFMSMANGFGLADEQAYQLSKSLTELSYDLSSLYNEDVSQSIIRLQSALAGEIEPVRRLGLAISEASLQEFALAHNINESVRSMSEQEKALLRSMALIEGAGRVGAIYDLARTLESPGNSIRMLQQQFAQLKTSIGTVLIPALVQIIPYVQAIVMVLTEWVRALATLVGFTMPEWDNSDWADNITTGANNATSAVDDTKDSVKSLSKALLGIDELTILQANTGVSAGDTSAPSWSAGVDIGSVWDEEVIKGIESQAAELKEKLKPLLETIALIGTAFLTWKISSGLITTIEKIKGMLSKPLSLSVKFQLLGLPMFLSDLNELKKYVEDFQKNGATFQNVVGMLSEFAGAVGDIFIMFGALKIGGALKIFQGIGEIIIAVNDIAKNGVNVDNALTAIRGLSNIAIGIGAFTGNLKLLGAGLILQGFTSVIRELSDNWDAIKQGDWSGVDKVTLIIGGLEILGGLAAALGAFSRLKSVANAGKAASAIETVATATTAVDTSVGGLSPKLASLAKNLGLGVVIIGEVAAAATLMVGAVALLGIELEQVGNSWASVLEDGTAVASGIVLGTTVIASVGLAAYALGTAGTTVAINLGIGTAILLELGIAAGLFVVEIWAIGKGLTEIGQAWQPVIENGENIAAGIGLGTTILVGIGAASAALGVASVATVGALPLAIGIGTAVLLELTGAFKLFSASITDIANELSENLAPALSNLNAKMPELNNHMSDFVDYMSGFSNQISMYTSSMGSLTWSSIVSGFQSLFAGNPILNLSNNVKEIGESTKELNANLLQTNPELETAISLYAEHLELLSRLNSLASGNGKIDLSRSAKDSTAYFVNIQEQNSRFSKMETTGTGSEQIVSAVTNANQPVINAVMAMGSMITKAVNDKDMNTYLDGRQLSRGLYPHNQKIQIEKGNSLVKRG